MHYGDHNVIGFGTLEFINTRPNEVWTKYELAKNANDTYKYL